MTAEFDFKAFKARALAALQAGKPLTDKDGVLAPLLENLLNAALEGEMDAHMNTDERDAGNRRNGYGMKQVQSSLGELTVQTPRDRDASFDPQFIKKRERILADNLSERIIGLYALGTSTCEISELMEEQYGNKLSAETISAITDRVLPELQSWRNRGLEQKWGEQYPVVIRSWQENWDRLSAYFEFTAPIPKSSTRQIPSRAIIVSYAKSLRIRAFYIRHGPRKAGLSGLHPHSEKTDDAGQ